MSLRDSQKPQEETFKAFKNVTKESKTSDKNVSNKSERLNKNFIIVEDLIIFIMIH